MALEHAPQELRGDKEFMLVAVSQGGWALQPTPITCFLTAIHLFWSLPVLLRLHHEY